MTDRAAQLRAGVARSRDNKRKAGLKPHEAWVTDEEWRTRQRFEEMGPMNMHRLSEAQRRAMESLQTADEHGIARKHTDRTMVSLQRMGLVIYKNLETRWCLTEEGSLTLSDPPRVVGPGIGA